MASAPSPCKHDARLHQLRKLGTNFKYIHSNDNNVHCLAVLAFCDTADKLIQGRFPFMLHDFSAAYENIQISI